MSSGCGDEQAMRDYDDLNKLNRMLASLCRRIEHDGYECYISEDDELNSWWTAFEKFEEKRLENLRKSGLAKLTEEERKALGFY